ncbi:hypothetical protein RchiOBHm_Chr5g0062421 [Rosa chinensis]|uniref:Uncharacterized protein n=1 Tax=Rosa chinensis TaxID=74649 RepID=A0A2P6QI72_ROSCH|nr:hypothetical protein RchiOBHm_Chr5g0062421 [Rosa chinensis]
MESLSPPLWINFRPRLTFFLPMCKMDKYFPHLSLLWKRWSTPFMSLQLLLSLLKLQCLLTLNLIPILRGIKAPVAGLMQPRAHHEAIIVELSGTGGGPDWKVSPTFG